MSRTKSHAILIVEDDEPLRFTLLHLFGADLEVTAVGTGEEALQAIKTLARIDLLLTDFDLRGNLDGLDVARAMKARDPKAPILVVTGSGRTLPRVQELLSIPNTVLIEKPFDPADLERAVCALLASGDGIGLR